MGVHLSGLGNSWVSSFAMALFIRTTTAVDLAEINSTYGSVAPKETVGLITSDGAMDFMSGGWGDDP